MLGTQATIMASVLSQHQEPSLIAGLHRQAPTTNTGSTNQIANLNQEVIEARRSLQDEVITRRWFIENNQILVNELEISRNAVPVILRRQRPNNDAINHWSNQTSQTNTNLQTRGNDVKASVNLDSTDEATQNLTIPQLVPGFLETETSWMLPIPETAFSEQEVTTYVGRIRGSFLGNEYIENSLEVLPEVSRTLWLVRQDFETRMWNRMDIERLRWSANLMPRNFPLGGDLETIERTYRFTLVAILNLLSPETLHQIGIALLGTPFGPIIGFLLPIRILLLSLLNPNIWMESYRTLVVYLKEGIQVVRRARQTQTINELTRRAGQMLLRFDWSWEFFHRTLFRQEWRTGPNLTWLTARAGAWSLLTLITRWGLVSAILRTYGINMDYILWQLVDWGGIYGVSLFLDSISSHFFF